MSAPELDDLDQATPLREAIASGKPLIVRGGSEWFARVREAAAVCDRLGDLIVLRVGWLSDPGPRQPVRYVRLDPVGIGLEDHVDARIWRRGTEVDDLPCLQAGDLTAPAPIVFVMKRRHVDLKALEVALARFRLARVEGETHVRCICLGDQNEILDDDGATARFWIDAAGRCVARGPRGAPGRSWKKAVKAYRRLPPPSFEDGMAILERHGLRAFVHPVREEETRHGQPSMAVHAVSPDGWVKTVQVLHEDGEGEAWSRRIAESMACAAVRGDVALLEEVPGPLAKTYGVARAKHQHLEHAPLVGAIARYVDVPTYLAAAGAGRKGSDVMAAIDAAGGCSRARRDFVRTWPALCALILSPTVAAEIDAGGRTLPIVMRTLEVSAAVARRVSALPEAPRFVRTVMGHWLRDLPRLGVIMTGIGHDRLPPPGNREEGIGFCMCLDVIDLMTQMSNLPLDSIPPETVSRLVGGIPGRTWAERLNRVEDQLKSDFPDIVAGLAGWLRGMGMPWDHEAAAFAILLQHRNLLDILRASRRWHATPELTSWSQGVSDDATWPVPFGPVDLSDGWTAEPLGSTRAMKEEGAVGTGGLDHCVATYAGRAMAGEILILSVRHGWDGDRGRISTAELTPSPEGDWNLGGRRYVLSQHRARGNASPSAEAVDALLRLKGMFVEGCVPVDVDAFGPRSKPDHEVDRTLLESQLRWWRPLLPRALARMEADALVERAGELMAESVSQAA